MRNEIRQVLQVYTRNEHVGLRYDMLAPVNEVGDEAGKVPNDQRKIWFESLAGTTITADYAFAFERWRKNLASLSATVATIETVAPLLVGHGNPSAADVGLTVHHTWGTPIIPGSSLKGLLHHYLVEKYGPDESNWNVHPLDSSHPEQDRADFQPAYWQGNAIVHAPGKAIRALFGAPDADTDDAASWRGNSDVGAAKGSLCYLDAYWIPDKRTVDAQPFATDILNVHQRRYYGQANEGRSWPSDYDSPVPVHFLTVKPKQKFLVAILGDEEMSRWAMSELLSGLAERGVGGKTTSGYGTTKTNGDIQRLKFIQRSESLDKWIVIIDGSTNPPNIESPTIRDRLEYLQNHLLPDLLKASLEVRHQAADYLQQSKLATNKKNKPTILELIQQIIQKLRAAI